MTNRPLLNQCKCSFAIRLNGDGCMYCNPEFWEEKLREQEDESSIDAKLGKLK